MGTRTRARIVLALAALALVLGTACGQRAAVLGQQMGGCSAAIGERSKATAAIDRAAEQAIARNAARADELRAIAAEGKTAIATAADLGSCDDPSGTRGVAVDLVDLRARYRAVIDRTTARLDETATAPPSQQAPAPRHDNTKGDDRKGSNKGRG